MQEHAQASGVIEYKCHGHTAVKMVDRSTGCTMRPVQDQDKKLTSLEAV